MFLPEYQVNQSEIDPNLYLRMFPTCISGKSEYLGMFPPVYQSCQTQSNVECSQPVSHVSPNISECFQFVMIMNLVITVSVSHSLDGSFLISMIRIVKNSHSGNMISQGEKANKAHSSCFCFG
jgi:hypothetical protein